jgi:hypothetical protein
MINGNPTPTDDDVRLASIILPTAVFNQLDEAAAAEGLSLPSYVARLLGAWAQNRLDTRLPE